MERDTSLPCFHDTQTRGTALLSSQGAYLCRSKDLPMHIPFECFQLDTCYPCSTRRYDRCIPLHYTAHFVSNKTKCRARNMYSRPVNLREDLRQLTSLDSRRFVEYMSTIGWPQDSVFVALLATVGYSFHDEKALIVPRMWGWRAAAALIVVISELYV